MRSASKSHTGVRSPGSGGSVPRSVWDSAVEVTAARGRQAELTRHAGIGGAFGRGVAAGDHLHALAAVLAKFGEQRKLFVGAQAVAGGVGDDGHAACVADPAHRVAQAGPAVRHEAGLAFGEEATEHFARVPAHPLLDQKARKVRARDQLRVAHVAQRALVGTGNAHLGQLGCHFLGAFAAPAAGLAQALHQAFVAGVKAQAHDVYRGVGKGDRDLCTCQKSQALRLGGSGGTLQAAHLVVVRQGPQIHPIGPCPGRHDLRLQRAIGNGAVAVQVGVGVGMGHQSILRVCPCLRRRCGGAWLA